eukprot:gene25381-31838_t
MAGGDPETLFDENWVQITEQKVNAQVDRFEAELSAAKSTMQKESIRTAHNNLAQFHRQTGNLNEAMKCYLRTRDFCATPQHNSEMCLNIIGISIDLNQFFNANNFLNKITDTSADIVLSSKLKAAAGMVFLHDSLYKAAALKFLEVDSVLGNSYTDVITSEDVGLYGTVCALATFTRQELRRSFVEKKGFFNNFTSLIPELKTLATGFIHGKYDGLLKHLDALRPRLLIDVHIGKSTQTLLNMIFERLIVQYCSPYDVVDMTRMATALGMDMDHLEKTVSQLITSDKLPARIDSQEKTLRRISVDNRSVLVEKVLNLAQVHSAATKRDLLRLSLLQNNFVVEAEGGDKGGRLGGDAREMDGPGNLLDMGANLLSGGIMSGFGGVMNMLGGGGGGGGGGSPRPNSSQYDSRREQRVTDDDDDNEGVLAEVRRHQQMENQYQQELHHRGQRGHGHGGQGQGRMDVDQEYEMHTGGDDDDIDI